MAKSSRDLLDDARRTVPEVSPQQVRAAAGSRTLIDVRERSEFDEGYIPGALHLSKGFIETQIEDRVPGTTRRSRCTAPAACARCSPPARSRSSATPTSSR